MIRIGHGYDVHAFGGDSPLILGGVTIPGHVGLLAHSDGDVVLHAVCDSLLGAAAMGDIGHHFPDTDLHFKNANSRNLLTQVVKKIHQKKYSISNLDITIIAQVPKIAPYIPEMKSNMSSDLDVSDSQINIKATTTEKLGYIGRKEGIAVHCVCLLASQH